MQRFFDYFERNGKLPPFEVVVKLDKDTLTDFFTALFVVIAVIVFLKALLKKYMA